MRTLFLVLALSSTAYADDSVVCARAAVGEIGWHNLDAAVAVTAVHVQRARIMGVSLGRACYLYSSALKTCARPWVCYLDTQPDPPVYWPHQLPWDWYRQRFSLILEVIRWYLAGGWPDPCGADHYGGPMDIPNNSWHILKCVLHTRQEFYLEE